MLSQGKEQPVLVPTKLVAASRGVPSQSDPVVSNLRLQAVLCEASYSPTRNSNMIENIRDIKADAMVISSFVAEDNGGFNSTDQP